MPSRKGRENEARAVSGSPMRFRPVQVNARAAARGWTFGLSGGTADVTGATSFSALIHAPRGSGVSGPPDFQEQRSTRLQVSEAGDDQALRVLVDRRRQLPAR